MLLMMIKVEAVKVNGSLDERVSTQASASLADRISRPLAGEPCPFAGKALCASTFSTKINRGCQRNGAGIFLIQ